MYKLAANIFVGASLAFMVLGICIVIVIGTSNVPDSGLMESFMVSILVILTSFAVMVAELSLYAVRAAQKYLRGDVTFKD